MTVPKLMYGSETISLVVKNVHKLEVAYRKLVMPALVAYTFVAIHYM